MSIWQVNSKPSSISCEKRIRKRKSFYWKNQLLGITGNEKLIQMMTSWWVTQQKALWKALKTLEGFPSSYRLVIKKWLATISVWLTSSSWQVGKTLIQNSMVNQKPIDSDDYHLQRDIFELALIKEAIKQKKPIFLSAVELNSLTLPWVELCIKISKTTGRIVLLSTQPSAW